MENSNDIIELLDVLYGMVDEAWGVPLGNDKCIIEREKAIEIINTIKANLPTSIAESKRLVQARDEFIGNAKREAENLRKSAEAEASAMIDQQEVLKVAREKSDRILKDVETKSAELKRMASAYVEEMIQKAEETLSNALDAVKQTQEALNATTQEVSSGVSSAPVKNEAAKIEVSELPLDDEWEEK